MKAARVRFSPSVDLNSLATRSRNGRKSLYARCNSSPCVPHCQRYRCCYRRCKSRQIKPMGIMLSINLFILKNKTRKQRIRNDLLPILYWNLPPWGSVYSIHQISSMNILFCHQHVLILQKSSPIIRNR